MNHPANPHNAIHAAIRNWYAHSGRKTLPWRTTADPYAIYLSEIMLQQTQVKTVLERFYPPFLATFPSLRALAEAPQESVLKAWEGLGYYTRARNLHRAAQATAPGYALPDTVEGLLALPGIGQNTAHAVAAFAYKQPVPVMEANVARVLSRLHAFTAPSPKELWGKAWALLDREDPFTYNQAMMDIGALVCTRRQPNCEACPLNSICAGKHAPTAYPAPKQKTRTPIRKRHILVAERPDGRLYVAPREGRFLAGLYGFIEQETHLPLPESAQKLGPVRQAYSHFTLEAVAYRVPAAEINSDNAPGKWATLQDVWAIPMSRADHKVLRLLESTPAHSPPVLADTAPENQ